MMKINESLVEATKQQVLELESALLGSNSELFSLKQKCSSLETQLNTSQQRNRTLMVCLMITIIILCVSISFYRKLIKSISRSYQQESALAQKDTELYLLKERCSSQEAQLESFQRRNEALAVMNIQLL